MLLIDKPYNKSHQNGRLGCASCAFFSECGGLPDSELLGCFIKCTTCDPKKCHWTCPKNIVQFVDRFREVGGWPPKPLEKILAPEKLDLPLYLPQIHNGRCRSEDLIEPIVAVPTFCILKGRKDGGYGPIEMTASSLRKALKISTTAKIILISVASDPRLERFWHFAEAYDVGPALRKLNIEAITAPNFSLFSDVPRTHTLWNLARICRTIEYLSSSGIKVIPHINAATQSDWHFWSGIMEKHENINHIVKEFQTGGRNKEIANASIQGLIKLREQIKRPFHPIIIGGGQYARILRKEFPQITFVDSTPFIKTHKRQKLTQKRLRPGWVKYETEPGESLHELLQSNVELHRALHRSRSEPICREGLSGLEGKALAPCEVVPKGQNEFSFVLKLESLNIITGKILSRIKPSVF